MTVVSNAPGLARIPLRVALLADAVVTGVNGLAYLALPGLLGGWFGLPSDLLRPVGVFLLGYAVVVALVASRSPVPRTAGWAIVTVNAAWTVVGLAAAAEGWWSASAVGRIWEVLQALVVLAFAVVQTRGLRR